MIESNSLNGMIYLSDVSLDFPCPYCPHKFHKTVGWAEFNGSFICPICGRDIHLNTTELLSALQVARTALAKLRDGNRVAAATAAKTK